MNRKIISFISVVFLLTSCRKNNDFSGVFKGPEVNWFMGKSWTWSQLDSDGSPLKVAISIDDAVLTSVPVGRPSQGHDHANMVALRFDPNAAILPFTHAGLNWNPSGHEPKSIYGKPHFDIHFYMISETDRLKIPKYEVDSTKFKKYVSHNYLPTGYFTPGGGDEKMGSHWIDVNAPELDRADPKPFTETFVYGTYDGKVTFYEPMMTLDFLKSTNTYERNIPQPAKFQVKGYYPTKMKVVKHQGITDIILFDFLLRENS